MQHELVKKYNPNEHLWNLISLIDECVNGIAFLSNNYINKYSNYKLLVGFQFNNNDLFISKENLTNINKSWIMGGLPYSYKSLKLKKEYIEFPFPSFFYPDCVIYVKNRSNLIHFLSSDLNLLDYIIKYIHKKNHFTVKSFSCNYDKQKFIKDVKLVQNEIHSGNVYQLNLTRLYYSENINKVNSNLFFQLNKISPMPFAAYFKWYDKKVICASPERFLQKKAGIIISQPIKGTIKRSTEIETDSELRNELLNSEKYHAESVMIVDLVRNDLQKSAESGSVQVSQLLELQTFAHLHHLEATISAKLKKNITINELLKNTFPAGSMTGAPKEAAIKLIDYFEEWGRGIYAGSLGYIEPNGDFDFNVVIRTLVHDSNNKILTFQTGGAITYDSNPESEYEEGLLKIKPILAATGAELINA